MKLSNNRISFISGFASFLIAATTLHAKDPESRRILCYGDSITAGGKWVKTVDEHKSFEAINAGRAGRRAAWAEKQLKPYLQEHEDLDMIVLFLGVNDLPSRDKRPGDAKVEGCVADMARTIDLAMTRFRPEDIILVAPCGVNPDAMSEVNLKKGYDATLPLLEKLEKEYKALAERKGTRFLSLFHVVSRGNFKDGLHPNQDGDAQIAKAVLAFLLKK